MRRAPSGPAARSWRMEWISTLWSRWASATSRYSLRPPSGAAAPGVRKQIDHRRAAQRDVAVLDAQAAGRARSKAMTISNCRSLGAAG